MSPDYRPSNSLVHRLGAPQPSNLTQNNNRNNAPKKDSVTGSPKLPRGVHTSRIRQFEVKKTPSPLRTRKYQQTIPQATTATKNNLNTNSPPKTSTTSDDEIEMCVSKLQSIRNVAQERTSKMNTESESSSNEKSEISAAIFIQKMWRGYHTRNRNKKALDILKAIQTHRTEQHIQ